MPVTRTVPKPPVQDVPLIELGPNGQQRMNKDWYDYHLALRRFNEEVKAEVP